jgi:predicted HD superfamily hydrolase involved in NAD metabolism
MSSRTNELIAARVGALPEGLRSHIYRVQQVAVDLAHQHSIEGEKAKLGALAHDIARAMKGEDLLRKARELGIAVHPVEAEVPILLHGPVAAETLRLTDGLEDQDIYEAVYWHSTAREGLGPAAKVVYLADKLDPQKVSRYPFLPELRALAMKSLDRAILEFLSRELVSLLRQGSLVHPTSVEARNELVLNLTHNRSHGGQHG